MLERQSGIALWRQIAGVLARKIENGELEPGARLKTEPQLAQHFGVNRHPVRRAISNMAERGLIKVEQGRGTFVTEHVFDYLIGRRTRFSELVNRQNRIPSGQLLGGFETLADDVVAEALEISVGGLVVVLDTLGEIDGRPISVATHCFPANRFPDLLNVHQEEGSITQTLTKYGLGDYERRTTKVTARMPDPKDADLLRQPRNHPILVAESINVDGNGVPVEYGMARFAADRFQIVFET